MNNDHLRKTILNPNGKNFQERYVSLGRVSGKEALNIDCKRLKIRVPSKALQIIEKGFSSKARKSWANTEGTFSDFSLRYGDDNFQYDKVTIKPKLTSEQQKEKSENDKNNAIMKENQKKEDLLKQKKNAKLEKIKKKLAKLDSWEELK